MLKKLIINLVLVAVFVYVLDLAIGRTMRYFYFRETSGLHYRTTYSMETTKAELIVFGSSSANHHYVPDIFEETLRLSFYNTGRDGQGLLYNHEVFKSILRRHTPKVIILDIRFDELYEDPKEFDRLSALLPYYENHPEIRSLIEKRSPFERIKLLSSIYPFNSALLAIAMGNMKFNQARKGDRKGYVPLENVIQETVINEIKVTEAPFDAFKLEVLRDMARTCSLKNIKLFLIQSPMYARVDARVFATTCRQISQEYQAIFIDCVNDAFFLQSPALFQDVSHLNADGAAKFSNMIAARIAFRTGMALRER